MGHLVELPTNRASAHTVEPGRSATILFFTGVRYYRMEEAAPPVAPSAPHRGRKRKARPAELHA